MEVAGALCRIMESVMEMCEWRCVTGASFGGVVEGWKRLRVDGTRGRRVDAFVVKVQVWEFLSGGRSQTVFMSRERCCMGGGM